MRLEKAVGGRCNIIFDKDEIKNKPEGVTLNVKCYGTFIGFILACLGYAQNITDGRNESYINVRSLGKAGLKITKADPKIVDIKKIKDQAALILLKPKDGKLNIANRLDDLIPLYNFYPTGQERTSIMIVDSNLAEGLSKFPGFKVNFKRHDKKIWSIALPEAWYPSKDTFRIYDEKGTMRYVYDSDNKSYRETTKQERDEESKRRKDFA